eukprot:COSAG05_NODE_504_length_9208_cov_22.420024_14_plen_64_part_00
MLVSDIPRGLNGSSEALQLDVITKDAELLMAETDRREQVEALREEVISHIYKIMRRAHVSCCV